MYALKNLGEPSTGDMKSITEMQPFAQEPATHQATGIFEVSWETSITLFLSHFLIVFP